MVRSARRKAAPRRGRRISGWDLAALVLAGCNRNELSGGPAIKSSTGGTGGTGAGGTPTGDGKLVNLLSYPGRINEVMVLNTKTLADEAAERCAAVDRRGAAGEHSAIDRRAAATQHLAADRRESDSSDGLALFEIYVRRVLGLWNVLRSADSPPMRTAT